MLEVNVIREKSMKINIEKSPVPIVYIDISIINSLYKEMHKKDNQMLYGYLREKVNDGNLICPLGGQDEECEDKSVEIFTCHSSISLNIEFKVNYDIEQYQFYQILNLMKNRVDTLNISYREAFYPSPLEELNKRTPMNNLWPYSHNPSIYEKSQRRSIKENWANAFNRFHNAGYKTKIEYTNAMFLTPYDAAIDIVSKITKDPENIQNQLKCVAVVGDNFQAFRRTFGQDKDIKDYLEFLRTDFFKAIPHIDIAFNMYSDILFHGKESKYKGSDKNDIEYLSHYLPYCNLMIIDSAQSQRVRDLKLDKKYECNVLCKREIPFENISALDNYLHFT